MTISRVCKEGFEVETCSRCGGSGQYSYCQRFGSTCFKCRGSGATYTKRGAVAKAHYESLLRVLASQVKPGDLIQCEVWSINGESSRKYFAPVIDIEVGGAVVINGVEQPRGLSLVTLSPKWGRYTTSVGADGTVRRGMTAEEKAPFLAQAHAYQVKLTKAGTVRKR